MPNFPTQEHIDAAQAAEDYWLAKTGHRAWASVALAQAADESAYWTKLAAKNNGFGITATKEQIAAGKASYDWTHEWENGKLVPRQRWFAAFDTLKDAYMAHARILTDLSIYHDAWSQPDADHFLAAIAPHYATMKDYAGIIRGYMKALNTYQYDRVLTPGAKPKPQIVAHPATIPAASGLGGVVAGAVIMGQMTQNAHLPWAMIGAGVVVVGVVAAFVLAARKSKAVNMQIALTTPAVAPPPPPSEPVAPPPVAVPLRPPSAPKMTDPIPADLVRASTMPAGMQTVL